MVDEIRRSLEFLPGEVGSRRVTSDQLRALLDELQKMVPRFSGFTVWRFGHHDRLEYPIDRLPEAIDHYDVRRINGRGYLDEEPFNPFIEIDLWAGGNVHNWDWLFRLYGPKTKVDSVAMALREHVDRWQTTWHRWFHHQTWNWASTGILTLALVIRLGSFAASPSFSGGLQIGVLVYLLGFMALVLAGTGALAPFIWFYRPGSPIEARRQWLPRLSIFAGLAVIGGVTANWVWSLIGK